MISMKTLWLSLCAGLAFAAAAPCRAQQPAPTGAESPAVPLMLVYVARPDDDMLPRIALGVEAPAVKIMAFEKCVQVSANPQLPGIAAQLQAEDAKALVAAVKALGAPDARELPDVVLWFTTPDNKELNSISTGATNGAEANLIKGIFFFDPRYEQLVVPYLEEKLHPK